MHRIDSSTAKTTPPVQKAAEGPQGYFQDGLDGTGAPSTKVTADWANAVQEEIVTVISNAGLSLNKTDNTQLYQAIIAIASSLGWRTGDIKATLRNTADPGWVLLNDGTIGRNGSAATTRANDDTWALYELIWNNVSNTFAAVSGGRGATAADDFAASKTIALPKALGRVLGAAGAGASLSTRTLGQTVGAETHTLSQTEMPVHSHTNSVSTNGYHGHSAWTDAQGDHEHWCFSWVNIGPGSDLDNGGRKYAAKNMAPGFGFDEKYVIQGSYDYPGTGATSIAGAHGHNVGVAGDGNHSHTVTINNAGSGGAHNNMQPTLFVNYQIKL